MTLCSFLMPHRRKDQIEAINVIYLRVIEKRLYLHGLVMYATLLPSVGPPKSLLPHS